MLLMNALRRISRGSGSLAVASLVVFLAFILLFQTVPTLSRILDPGTVSPERTILSLVADDLDKRGIDTVFGRSTDHPLPANRVRIAPLSSFTPNKRDWGSYDYGTWAAAFQKEVVGFIIALPGSPSAISAAETSCLKNILDLGSVVCDFIRQWVTSSPDERVFIAFTKEDFEHATKVSKALEGAGYTVFLFLKEKDGKPWADPGMVGEIFAKSKYRLVIDSKHARGSPGVALERECCEWLLLPPPPTTPLMLSMQGRT